MTEAPKDLPTAAAQATEGDEPPLAAAPTKEPMVVITGVNKHFGELHVLRDIDLTVGRGEVVVVLGPSGSGKSTLCRTINRLEPFETGSIDAVISRFCLMFLPEIPKAAAEIARVLKPGGYVAAAVWSAPDKNPFIRIPMDVIKTITPLPPPDPEAPGIFRLAKPGDLAGMFERAGLKPLDDEEFTAEVTYATAEEFFRGLMDIAAPIQNLFAKLTQEQQAEAERGIVKAVNEYRGPQGVSLPIAVRIVSARKPQ